MQKVTLNHAWLAHERARHPGLRYYVAAMMLLGLAACQAVPIAKPLTPQESAALKPADAKIATLYDQSCRNCHTLRDSGAPLAGDRTLWNVRWAKGMPVLMQNAIGGYNKMPAGGQCVACTAKDYEALIRFMAGHEGEPGAGTS